MDKEIFYIDNLLFTNGSDSAKNYQVVVDVFLKELMLLDGMTPFALCMGYENLEPVHKYKAFDKLRPYELVHGNMPSHGICPRLFEILKDV